MGVERVGSHQKGNEAGMTQMTTLIKTLGLTDQLSLSVWDSLYGTQTCRMAVAAQENWIHLFRLNSTRNVFAPPPELIMDTVGRHKEFGEKMKLNDPSTHPPCDDQTTTTWTTRRGKSYTVHIRRWKNRLLRGSRQFHSASHPMHVIQIEVIDESGQALYRRPLWLAVLGKRRDELDLIQCYNNYTKRYDIEHFFRFGKRCLLMDAYQTPEVEHEGHWWKLCMLAYTQLYLARHVVPLLPHPWERYLPSYKNASTTAVTTPSQTQRGFARLLERIGTPAADCVPRGKPRGRMANEIQSKRETKPIVFKATKMTQQTSDDILSGSESVDHSSHPQNIDDLLNLVQSSLEILKLTPSEFSDMLINSS